jgi:nucleotide-binding universal stress UspA family protein
MLSFQHIVVGTDFGEPAQHALELAIDVAAEFDATLTLVHVYAVPPMPYGSVFALVIDELAATARKSLDEELAKVQMRYPKCTAVLLGGSPAHQLISAAKDTHADLVVVGTHGRRGVPRALIGSVAEKVVRLCPCPVLSVSLAGEPP